MTVTGIIAGVLQVAGLVLLVVGYRKRDRNFMLGAALMMYVGGFLDEFVRGLVAGWFEFH
jgi:hypothetical protein